MDNQAFKSWRLVVFSKDSQENLGVLDNMESSTSNNDTFEDQIVMAKCYLEHAKGCMERIRTMTFSKNPTSLQLNHGLCQYISDKLNKVFSNATMQHHCTVISLLPNATSWIKVQPSRNCCQWPFMLRDLYMDFVKLYQVNPLSY